MNRLVFQAKSLDVHSDDYTFLQDSIETEISKILNSILNNIEDGARISGFRLEHDSGDPGTFKIDNVSNKGVLLSSNQRIVFDDQEHIGISLVDDTPTLKNYVLVRFVEEYGTYNAKTKVYTPNVALAIDKSDYSTVFNRRIDAFELVVMTPDEYAAIPPADLDEYIIIGQIYRDIDDSYLVDNTLVTQGVTVIADNTIVYDMLNSAFMLPQEMVEHYDAYNITGTYENNLKGDLEKIRENIRNIKSTSNWDDATEVVLENLDSALHRLHLDGILEDSSGKFDIVPFVRAWSQITYDPSYHTWDSEETSYEIGDRVNSVYPGESDALSFECIVAGTRQQPAPETHMYVRTSPGKILINGIAVNLTTLPEVNSIKIDLPSESFDEQTIDDWEVGVPYNLTVSSVKSFELYDNTGVLISNRIRAIGTNAFIGSQSWSTSNRIFRVKFSSRPLQTILLDQDTTTREDVIALINQKFADVGLGDVLMADMTVDFRFYIDTYGEPPLNMLYLEDTTGVLSDVFDITPGYVEGVNYNLNPTQGVLTIRNEVTVSSLVRAQSNSYYIPRYDVITVNDLGVTTVHKGTPSFDPTIALPTLSVNEMMLKVIYVPPYITSLTSSELIDYHRFVQKVPYVTSIRANNVTPHRNVLNKLSYFDDNGVSDYGVISSESSATSGYIELFNIGTVGGFFTNDVPGLIPGSDSTKGYAEITNIGILGTFDVDAIPEFPTDTYTLNVEVDGDLESVSFYIKVTDDWYTITGKMQSVLRPGGVTPQLESVRITESGKIRVTSETVGSTSSIVISSGAGNDFLTALDALTGYTHSLSSVPGVDGSEENVGIDVVVDSVVYPLVFAISSGDTWGLIASKTQDALQAVAPGTPYVNINSSNNSMRFTSGTTGVSSSVYLLPGTGAQDLSSLVAAKYPDYELQLGAMRYGEDFVPVITPTWSFTTQFLPTEEGGDAITGFDGDTYIETSYDPFSLLCTSYAMSVENEIDCNTSGAYLTSAVWLNDRDDKIFMIVDTDVDKDLIEFYFDGVYIKDINIYSQTEIKRKYIEIFNFDESREFGFTYIGHHTIKIVLKSAFDFKFYGLHYGKIVLEDVTSNILNYVETKVSLTGNETIPGDKTFSGETNFSGNVLADTATFSGNVTAFDLVPVGTIISRIVVPGITLPDLGDNWEPLDGQYYSDVDSIFDDRRLPNANGADVVLTLTFVDSGGYSTATVPIESVLAIGKGDVVTGAGVPEDTVVESINYATGALVLDKLTTTGELVVTFTNNGQKINDSWDILYYMRVK